MTSTPASGHAAGSRQVGSYTLLARIGEGGMGVVHLARRPDGTRVALKVLRPQVVGDDEARARLAREVGSLRRIRSRWIAEILDADPWAEVPYVATRYVPGLSLHDHVVEEGPITGSDLTWFAACLAEGLAAVHAAGVLHRDVKPANVLMEGRTPILIDFGLARVADDPRLTHTGWLIGTPGYLAPEILYGDDATPASDLHSWAATVAWAGTGRAPFGRGPSMAIMDRVRRGEHDLSGLPAELRRLLEACLDPDPGCRPALDAVRRWLAPRAGLPAAPEARPDADPDAFTRPLPVAAPPEPAPSGEGVPTRRYTEHPERPVRPEHPEDPGQPWAEDEPSPVARVRLAERSRRGLLLVAGGLTAGAAVAAYPLPVVAALLVGTWLLRGGSLAASAAEDRRRQRGRRWYDGAQLLLAAPWHLLRSVGSSLLLALWAAGLGVAAALVCYAAAAGTTVTLFVTGTTLAAALWAGPGGSRVRGPLARVVHPVSRGGVGWLLALLLVTASGVLLGLRVDAQGTSWAPAQERPLDSWQAPDWLRGR